MEIAKEFWMAQDQAPYTRIEVGLSATAWDPVYGRKRHSPEY
jgi:hypothetical protein